MHDESSIWRIKRVENREDVHVILDRGTYSDTVYYLLGTGWFICVQLVETNDVRVQLVQVKYNKVWRFDCYGELLGETIFYGKYSFYGK